MKKPLVIAEDVCQITPEWLRGQGIRAVLADLDNTLAGYRVTAPDKAVDAWIRSLHEAGIPLMIVSNAGEERVAAFCRPLGLPYIARAGKPGGRSLLEALRQCGVDAGEGVMIGDQYFTDIRAGRKAGMRTVLVAPRVKGFWFTLRRCVEKPFIGRKAERI